MPDSGNRYRADLIQWAVEEEPSYGAPPDIIRRGVGLVNFRCDSTDPNFEWQPFYGIGVENRNMLFPIQGREVLQGSISMLCTAMILVDFYYI